MIPYAAVSETIFAIVGPTASGKTACALTVAEQLGAEIVSCDSMQLYREFDVGAAKPSAEERARVRHHLVDLLPPDQTYSAARYADDADRAIADIRARHKRVLIVGGTGLYLRALRFGLFAAPPRDDELRQRLLAEEAAEPGCLHRKLREVDPPAATRIAPADLVRLVRALEVHALTGVPLSQHHAEHRPAPRHPVEVMLLDPPRDTLDSRIASRVDVMLAGGLVDETRRIRAQWGHDVSGLSSVGYAEVSLLLDGKLAASELPTAIVRSTRRYARRQRTWFKKEAGARRFANATDLTRAIDAACRP
ncbi:MAG: tRNA dimethylallyltransferase [Myxococcales bacterium]|nr:tRNA dimethylallyltransferase [Myxococcales bacterium]